MNKTLINNQSSRFLWIMFALAVIHQLFVSTSFGQMSPCPHKFGGIYSPITCVTTNTGTNVIAICFFTRASDKIYCRDTTAETYCDYSQDYYDVTIFPYQGICSYVFTNGAWATVCNNPVQGTGTVISSQVITTRRCSDGSVTMNITPAIGNEQFIVDARMHTLLRPVFHEVAYIQSSALQMNRPADIELPDVNRFNRPIGFVAAIYTISRDPQTRPQRRTLIL